MKETTLRNLALAMAFLLPVYGYSQQLGGTTADKKMQGSATSANAMSGLYTPNLYDGTANINVPIYQYGTDGGDYGISLGYNTRGVRVSEPAGQIGLHWTLNAGGSNGSIQRAVKDIPDDIYEEMYDSLDVDNHRISNPDRKTRGRLVVFGETASQAAEAGVYRDKESDDYTVSIGTLSFTFNLGKNGYVFTNPQRNVKVELLYNGNPVQSLPSLKPMAKPEFRITDEQGNRYYFVVGDWTYDEVKDKFGYEQNIGSYSYATSWVIKKVVTASGAEINYWYNNYKPPYTSSFKNYSCKEPDGTPGGGDEADKVNHARIDSISYPNGVTAFFQYGDVGQGDNDQATLDNTVPALRKVQLLSGGKVQLQYKLNQSYRVGSDVPGTSNYTIPYGGHADPQPNGSIYNINGKFNFRLVLDSISVAGSYGSWEKLYSFTYDALLLPQRFNGSQDFFGYYNGKTMNLPMGSDKDMSIPVHHVFGYSQSFWGTDRTPDINFMKAGVLTGISNAFGGQVQFLYDAHQLENVMDGLPSDNLFLGKNAADGLRLQAIIEKDIFHPENYRKTTFTYSGGQFFLNGGYFHYPFLLNDGDHLPKVAMMTNQFISRHQMVNGANHGYSNVTVNQVDQDNNLLSKTEYTFSNFKDGNNAPKYLRTGNGSKHFFEFPFADKQFLRDWEMGLPLNIKEYDQNNRITLETVNTYAFSLDSVSSAGKIENTKLTPVRTDWSMSSMSTLPHTVDFTDSYRPFRGMAQLQSSQTKKYISDNAYVIDSVTYKYDSRNNIVNTLASNSKGEFFKTENIYNYNLDMLQGSGLQAYTDAGLEKTVSSQRWKTDATGNTYVQLMDGFINTFDYSNQQVKPKAMYNLVPGDAVSRNMYTGNTGSGPGIPNPHSKIIQAFVGTVPAYFRKASEVILSDAKGNPLESRLGDQDIFKAMIWDDVTGQKLAEAGSCHYTDIAYCGFETPATGMVTKGNITYNASNVETTPPSGSIYGSSFRFSTAPDGNSINGSQVLTAGKEYILSFWTNGTSLPLVYSGSTLLPLPANPDQIKDNQKYYRLRFTASANDKFKIQYSGSGITNIDDVRLHPVTAQMQNWSSTPMFGPGLSVDANGHPTFMEYDSQGRPKIVRDKDGNIISKTEYGVQ